MEASKSFAVILLVGLAAVLTRQGMAQAQTPSGAPRMASRPAQAAKPSVRLCDQFGKVHSLAELRGHVVVLVYGDRTGSEKARVIGQQLHVMFHPSAKGKSPAEASRAPARPVPHWPAGVPIPDVKVVPVACIGWVPDLVGSVIRNRFRAAVPDVPVWLDMGTRMKDSFGLDAGIANIAIVDTQGRFRFRAGGKLSPQQIRTLESLIAALRRESGLPVSSTSARIGSRRTTSGR